MQSAVAILRRWQAMDCQLGDMDGLNIPQFARRWKVSTRTVHRDLDAFRALGQHIAVERDPDAGYR